MKKLFLMFFLLFAVSAMAADVVLKWDANTEPDLAGYHVYWSGTTGVYGPFRATVPVSAEPTYTVVGLANGTYFFTVTAFNKGALESGYSNEVTTTILTAPLNPHGLTLTVVIK
jgi:hypothetical protein